MGKNPVTIQLLISIPYGSIKSTQPVIIRAILEDFNSLWFN